MSISLPKTSISILDARIKLLTIPREHLRDQMYAVTRCLAFRKTLSKQRGSDPFFNLTLNAVEVSIFADSELIDTVFTEELSKQRQTTHRGDRFGQEKEKRSRKAQIEISEDTWIALQVEQHDADGNGDDHDEAAGSRVRDISAPLAAEGISILFLSTYISDFLLIKQYRLELVIEILQRESFYSHDAGAGPSQQPGNSADYSGQGTSRRDIHSQSASTHMSRTSSSSASQSSSSFADPYLELQPSRSQILARRNDSEYSSGAFSFHSVDSYSRSAQDGVSRSNSGSQRHGGRAGGGGTEGQCHGPLSRSLTGSVLLSDRERPTSSRKQSTMSTVEDHRGSSSLPASLPSLETPTSLSRSNSKETRQSSSTRSRSASGMRVLDDQHRPMQAGSIYSHSILSPHDIVMSPSGVEGEEAQVESTLYDSIHSLAAASAKSTSSTIENFLLMGQDNIELLPDELVCVGLSLGEAQERLWRIKIFHALFYYDDILPRPKAKRQRRRSNQRRELAKKLAHQTDIESSSASESDDLALHDDEDDDEEDCEDDVRHQYTDDVDDAQQNLSDISLSKTPTAEPTMRRPMSMTEASHNAEDSDAAYSHHRQPSSHRTFSNSSHSSVSQSLDANAGDRLVATKDAGYPIPFLSLTLTVEGGSLIADIRLLRALFNSEEDAGMVYASGQGGLFGLWGDEEEGDYDDGDEDDAEDGVRERSGRSAVEDERNDEETASRKLYKCLQLDLTNFDLEKAGLVHQFAGLLTDQSINLLYSSTFRTANILVEKRNIRKARLALESATR